MNPKEEYDKKQQELFEKTLGEEQQMVFTKRELLVIFNILTGVSYKYGDFVAIAPIVGKLNPIINEKPINTIDPIAPTNNIIGTKKIKN